MKTLLICLSLLSALPASAQSDYDQLLKVLKANFGRTDGATERAKQCLLYIYPATYPQEGIVVETGAVYRKEGSNPVYSASFPRFDITNPTHWSINTDDLVIYSGDTENNGRMTSYSYDPLTLKITSFTWDETDEDPFIRCQLQ